ncbi:MAG: hypothetical protein RI967_625 [Planctomycetota bacterium]|jgi:hypothetical protein
MLRNLSILLSGAAALAASDAARAQHSDIGVAIEGGALVTADVGAKGLIPSRVFPASFGDTGVPRFTSNPGFDAAVGTLTPGSRLGFNILSPLARFTGDGLEPVAAERIGCAFLTLSATAGLEPTAGFDLAVQSNGGFHRHLSFSLFGEGGEPAASGVYAFELELYSTDGVTAPSAPFWIAFNDGRPATELDAALAWIAANALEGGDGGGGGNPCPADLDANGSVEAADLAVLLGAWGSADAPAADLNGDALVDAADLAALLAAWGSCP